MFRQQLLHSGRGRQPEQVRPAPPVPAPNRLAPHQVGQQRSKQLGQAGEAHHIVCVARLQLGCGRARQLIRQPAGRTAGSHLAYQYPALSRHFRPGDEIQFPPQLMAYALQADRAGDTPAVDTQAVNGDAIRLQAVHLTDLQSFCRVSLVATTVKRVLILTPVCTRSRILTRVLSGV